MQKIANPQDLESELQRLIHATEQPGVSRQVMAAEILALSDRVAGVLNPRLKAWGEHSRELARLTNLSEFYQQLQDNLGLLGKVLREMGAAEASRALYKAEAAVNTEMLSVMETTQRPTAMPPPSFRSLVVDETYNSLND